MANMEVGVVLAAAGKSSRFGTPQDKKVFCEVHGKPLWQYSAEAFRSIEEVKQLILVVSPTDHDFFLNNYADQIKKLEITVVQGGTERADSVLNGLEALESGITHVAVHDAARPCIQSESIGRVLKAALESGAAILASACHSTLKRTGSNLVVQETIPRQGVWLAQTPQVFAREILERAYDQSENASVATDEASLVEAAGISVQVVAGPASNLKVTTLEDLQFVRFQLSGHR